MLLTDDGTFAHDILAPKRHVSKTYTVVLDTPLTEQMRTGFAAGVTLADGTALSPAEVTALSADGCTVRVVLKQGVYHQIKRMFGVYGAGVNGLHRDAIGGLALDPALAPGQWRELSAEEVSKNFQLTGSAFHPNFKKATHFSGRIGGRTTQKGTFLVQNGP